MKNKIYNSVKKNIKIYWRKNQNIPSVISDPIQKMRLNIEAYKTAYDFPGAHRTSNMLDRLMQKMDRHLLSTRFVHGSLAAAELSIRGWALIHNFAPSNPGTIKRIWLSLDVQVFVNFPNSGVGKKF